ncbi:dihydrofolate reductase family protein [Nitratireductor pacificus]|nr:dihydrofolate reductase family protein [Nitratireductor pacificus]
MSGKIIVTQYMSLDGVIEDPVGMEDSGLGDWTGPFTRGPEGDAFKHEELMSAQAMIYGRKTYDGFAAVWPTVDDEAGYARRMNSLPKYLASTTIGKPEWNNTSLLSGDLADATRDLKEKQDGDILIFGSASVVHALMPHGLIDEFRLMVYPTVLGRGIRLFPDGTATMLGLAECRTFNDGIVLLRYETNKN